MLPDGDSARLATRHNRWIQDAVIELQLRSKCHQNHLTTYKQFDDTDYECGATRVTLPGSPNTRAIEVSVTGVDDNCGQVIAYGVSERVMRGAMSSYALTTCNPSDRIDPPEANYATGSYTTDLSVILTTDTEGATIYWTTDPNAGINEFVTYTLPINVTETTTLRAFASVPNLPPSEVVSWTYTLTEDSTPLPQLPTPVFSPTSGSFVGSVLVTITCPGATIIRYTLNGFPPDETSTLYTGPLLFTADQTVRARGFAPDYTPSEVATADYAITTDQVAPVTVNPPSGTVFTPTVQVVASTVTPLAAIYYTTDGSDPDQFDTIFVDMVELAATTTLKFRAFRPGYAASIITTALYTLDTPTLAGYWGGYSGPTILTADLGLLNAFSRTEEEYETTPYDITYTADPSNPWKYYIVPDTAPAILTGTAGIFTLVPADFAGASDGYNDTDANGWPCIIEDGYRKYRLINSLGGTVSISIQHDTA